MRPNSHALRVVHFLTLTILFGCCFTLPVAAQSGPPPLSPEEIERDTVDHTIAQLRAQCASFTKTFQSITDVEQATSDLVELQRNQIGGELQSLSEIRRRLQAIIQISALLPQFTGAAHTTAQNKVVELQFELAKLKAAAPKPTTTGCAATPGSTPPPVAPQTNSNSVSAPANTTAPPQTTALTDPPPQDSKNKTNNSSTQLPAGGALAGRVLDDLTGQPLADASVIAKCGANGEGEYNSRTDAAGFYHFDAILESTCLIRAAKFLTPLEVDMGKKSTPAAAFDCNKTYDIGSTANNAEVISAVAKAHAEDGPQLTLRSYQERTVKNLTPSSSGTPTLVQDLRLSERRASIGEFARTIVGFEQSGASSAPSVQKYFTDFWVSIPFPLLAHRRETFKSRIEDFNFGMPFRLWGDFRITSVPQQVSSSIGEFAVTFTDQIGAVKVNQVAQATEFMIGGEYRLMHWGVTSSRLLSFDQSSRERFALYATTGFGRITPLNPRDSLEVFKNPTPGTEPDFDNQIARQNLTSQIAGKQFLAFIPDDRYKFYKEYYTGFRIKTFYYDRDTDEPLRRFPATLEASFGQNETVTGGRLHRVVARLEGFYPLPYDAVHFMYLFGTADLIMGGQKGGRAILLDPATNAPAIPDPSVFIIHAPQLDRDHYRLGVGIDFLQLVDAIKNKNKDKPATEAPAPAPAKN